MEKQYNVGMQSMASLFEKRMEEPKEASKGPSHRKSAIVDEIIKVVGISKRYGYGYWLKKIGNRGYGDVMAMLKDVQGAPDKFPKGALLTNKLKVKTNNVQANKIQDRVLVKRGHSDKAGDEGSARAVERV
jgi:hypothetical protein